MPPEPAPPLGLRLLLADRYRVDARLLTPNARVDGVDTHAVTGRRVRVACLEPAGPGDAAERLQAWEGAHAAGLPVCRALAALDDEPGPLLVLEPPPPRALAGDGAALAAQARLLAGALAERGLRAGEIGAGDLALDDAGGLVLAVPPPVAPVVDPRAEAERLVATVLAAAAPAAPAAPPPDPPPGGRWTLRRPGRRGMWRGAALAVAAAAVLLLVGGSVRHGRPASPEPAPAAAHSPLAPAEPAGTAPLELPDPSVQQPPTPLRETAGSRTRPPRRTPSRPPPSARRPPPAVRPVPRVAPPPAPPRRSIVPAPRPSRPAGPAGGLGPVSPLGPTGAGREP